MELPGASVVVTGGGSGIGRALSRRFAADGARVAVADLHHASAAETVELIGAAGGTASAIGCDVRDEEQITSLVDAARAAHGPIDLFCSNAGITVGGGPETSDAGWDDAWRTNFLSHVHATRAVLPEMLARGRGYLLHTASAAGLLTSLADAPYTVTKHAVVGYAEWLSITYGDRGIGVSCLCPQGVDTAMLRGSDDSATGQQVMAVAEVLAPETVADAVVEALREERFLVLPHPEVHTYFQRKAADHDRWLRGMRRLQARLDATS